MSEIENELKDYVKKNNIQDFLGKTVSRILEHKPENPLFYIYIQNVISKEKNEKTKLLLECYYDLMVYQGRPETGKNILPDLFHKLSSLDSGSIQDPTVPIKYIEKLTNMVLLDFPPNAVKLVAKNFSKNYDTNLEYEDFEAVVETLLGIIDFFNDLKEYIEDISDKTEGIGPEDICQFIDKSQKENIVIFNLKNLLERSELTFDPKKFNNFTDVMNQLLEQAL